MGRGSGAGRASATVVIENKSEEATQAMAKRMGNHMGREGAGVSPGARLDADEEGLFTARCHEVVNGAGERAGSMNHIHFS